jgi:nicotinate-nucleotide pyrophosphorylase (carboxylating)
MASKLARIVLTTECHCRPAATIRFASTMSSDPTDFSSLLPHNLESVVEGWIHDDMPSFDVGGLVVGDEEKQAQLLMKSPGVFAGKPFCDLVFKTLGCKVEWNEELAVEGVHKDITEKICLATVTGPAHMLLRGERTALNTLSRCSGVASLSREAADTAKSLGWDGWVAGTRKTTPGFRIVEKYGLLVGGAATHRLVRWNVDFDEFVKRIMRVTYSNVF